MLLLSAKSFLKLVVRRLIPAKLRLYRFGWLRNRNYRPGPIDGMWLATRRESWMTPLAKPKWIDGQHASAIMKDKDPVLGLIVADIPYALPWWIMKNHHVANLDLGGQLRLVTLCEACSSACAFSPEVDGTRLNFHIAGQYNGTHVVRDYETETIWASFTGEGLHGRFAGRVLEPLPLFQCTWTEWTDLYPETYIPSGDGESRDGHGHGAEPGSPELYFMNTTLEGTNPTMGPNELILGLSVDSAHRAYPVPQLHRQPVINDTVGDEPVVILSRKSTLMAGTFSRRLRGQTLTFAFGDDHYTDVETGSKWLITGEGIDGPFRGEKLRYVKSQIEEWYVWAAYHPTTQVFGVGVAI